MTWRFNCFQNAIISHDRLHLTQNRDPDLFFDDWGRSGVGLVGFRGHTARLPVSLSDADSRQHVKPMGDRRGGNGVHFSRRGVR